MKNLLLTFLAFVFLIACEKENLPQEPAMDTAITNPSGLRKAKVNVCHNGHIIHVSVNAIPAHQAHGDAIDMDGDGYFDIDNACTETDCDDTNPAINPGAGGMNGCMEDLCAITALQVLNATCTDPDPTYDLQLQVTFENPPAGGSLDVSLDGVVYSFAIGASPQTVNVFGLPPTGVDVSVIASFSDDPSCELIDNNLYQAPDCGL